MSRSGGAKGKRQTYPCDVCRSAALPQRRSAAALGFPGATHLKHEEAHEVHIQHRPQQLQADGDSAPDVGGGEGSVQEESNLGEIHLADDARGQLQGSEWRERVEGASGGSEWGGSDGESDGERGSEVGRVCVCGGVWEGQRQMGG